MGDHARYVIPAKFDLGDQWRQPGSVAEADAKQSTPRQQRHAVPAAATATDPGLVMELHIDASRAVLEAFDGGALDAAIVLGHDAKRRDGDVLFEDKFGWMAAPDFRREPGEALRLATQAEPCSVRAMAVGVLDAAGVAWTEVFVGGGVATIGAALSAGLAVAALARRVAPPDTIDLGPRLGLPPLPSREVMLYSKLSDARTRRALRTLGAAFSATAA